MYISGTWKEMKMAEMISMPQLIDGWSSLSGLNAAMK